MTWHVDSEASSQRDNNAFWLIGSLLTAVAIGLSTPFLLQGALEAYAVVLFGVVVIGVMAMPRKLTFNDRACWRIFLVSLGLFAIYPAYISIQISGLPWISPMRVALAMLLLTWLYALRASHEMQARISHCVRANRIFFILLGVFVATQALSIPTSRNPGMALQKFLLFQLYWTFPFFVVVSLANTRSRLQKLGALIIIYGAIQCAVGFLEARQERLIWLDYLPPGFGADSEVLTRIVQGTFRAEGYRVQGSFSVSLLYAEFLALVLPFALFAAIDSRSVPQRLFGLLTAMAILPAQYLSGSRLGMVGTITVFLTLTIFFVMRKWRQDRRGMLGPFLMMMSPFAFVAFAVFYISSPRLRAMTVGGGEHQASTDSRIEMWWMGIPRILERPLFGHGSGLGAETLGFTNPAGTLTIDSYWLSALLEFGVVGAFSLLAMTIWAIHAGLRTYLDPRHEVNKLGAPISVSLIAFLVIKMVLSQVDNHLLAFVMMAMIVVIRSVSVENVVPKTRASKELDNINSLRSKQRIKRSHFIKVINPNDSMLVQNLRSDCPRRQPPSLLPKLHFLRR
jgi:O-antigen ligase